MLKNTIHALQWPNNSFNELLITHCRNTLKVNWVGFEDTQSHIHHYKVCVKSITDQNICGINETKLIYRGDSIVISDLDLKHTVPHIARVEVCNNVNLCVNRSSKHFAIDDTAPVIDIPAHVITYASLKPDTQFDNSYFSVSWGMHDQESPMYQYTVSLVSHDDGAIPVDNLIVGNVNSTTVPLPDNHLLNDGTLYTAKIVGCNSAYLCTMSETDEFLVDSSPPTLGGFVQPMKWERKKSGNGTLIHLSWQGFGDPHSEVAFYYITVSSSYSGSDLSGRIITVLHNSSLEIQTTFLNIAGNVVNGTTLYLSIWAENGVGLKTDVKKSSVIAFKTKHNKGDLIVEMHSCETFYCTQDCTCAVVNAKCGISFGCVNSSDSAAVVSVFDGLFGHDIMYTPSQTCLPGYWMSDYNASDVLRYEWSVGMYGQSPGAGVLSEKVWFDVDMHDCALYCLPSGSIPLEQGQTYAFYTRVWHNENEYTVYQSDGVTIDFTPPAIGKGRHVKDTDAGFEDDIDFTQRIQGFFAEWENVFTDVESGIVRYEVTVGHTPGGKYLIVLTVK